jgi:hypothetical protein
MSESRETLNRAARTIALESSVNAGRVAAALLAMDEASGPLRASSGSGASGGGKSDPTPAALGLNREGDGPVRYQDTSAHDRNRVEKILLRQLATSKELTGILSQWLPDEDRQKALRGVPITDDAIWCPNHQANGISETRAPGHKLCEYCDEFKRKYKGKLPNRWLLDVRQRRRINSTDEAKALNDIAVEERERRVAKKLANDPAA